MSFVSKFTKRDLQFSLLTGLITGLIAWQIFRFLHVPEFYNTHWSLLVGLIPILWILGVALGYFLSQWLVFFNQFGKFAAIGFTNAAVTFGVLNILLAYTGYVSGIGYSFISSVSFVVGVISSYIWNKYWAFKSNNNDNDKGKEFAKFFIVNIIAFIVNVSVASVVVNYIHPIFGMNAHIWANIGTAAGSAVALIFSFVGFKIVVFKD